MPDPPERPSPQDPAEAATALMAPFTGAGESPDRARLRRERAAALVRPDAGEPGSTIYTERWKEARERAGQLRRTRAGSRFARLLDHQERGWALVRPLALAVQDASGWRKGPDPASALYRFAEVEVVDLFRFNAFRCADMVLAPHDGHGFPLAEEIDGDTDAFYRCVHLLRLASAHPLAPPEFQVFAGYAAGLDGWYADFRGVFTPAADAYHGRRGGPRA
jgi:hypothetical protein